jgi:serine/tyrosine/threonine adenylyltransferase
MSVAAHTLFAFDNTFVRELEGLYEPWSATPAPAPRLLIVNEPLARELGVDPAALTPEALTGDGVAMAYSGHQFGGFSPRLGDGRALLLGEIVDVHGARRDLHLKGSGRTPFARGGDGKAVVGPMLREYVIGEAMHALGIPTSRALAVVATGEQVARETLLPGAVLARVAASHIRVGTFQYVTLRRDPGLLRRLADYTIARHYPGASYLELYDRVVGAQAELIAQWMLVGFIHGVMNTDNMAISGETIDYGPCAFMDAFDPDTVFSSIDHGGRYAYGNQPAIAQWNLARFAETLLPLIDADSEAAVEQATAVLNTFPERYRAAYARGMRAKLGVDADLAGDLIDLLSGVDHTTFFRALATSLRRDSDPARALFDDPSGYDAWRPRWLAAGPNPDAMDRVNPLYIPRNHLVEEALTAATAGDLAPFEALVDVVSHPFDERPGLERYAEPAPATFGPFQTFCGT